MDGGIRSTDRRKRITKDEEIDLKKLNRRMYRRINMKIICDCGNEEIFNTIDGETGEQTTDDEDEGQYATVAHYNFWQTHDVVGVVCKKCNKALWLFT